jgi:hypothetical protein
MGKLYAVYRVLSSLSNIPGLGFLCRIADLFYDASDAADTVRVTRNAFGSKGQDAQSAEVAKTMRDIDAATEAEIATAYREADRIRAQCDAEAVRAVNAAQAAQAQASQRYQATQTPRAEQHNQPEGQTPNPSAE